VGAINVSLLPYFHIGCETQMAFCWMGTGVVLRRVKGPGRDADHEPPSSAEFKNE
jgi:hypothetical protein